MKNMILICYLFPTMITAQLMFEKAGWEESIKQARNTGKLVFVHARTEWCEPCQEMEEYTFTDLEVTNFYKNNFINVQLDAENYPGVELAEKYDIALFPTFLFINGNGDVIHRGCGAMDATQFLHLAEDALSDSLTLAVMEKRYIKGERSLDFMLNYLQVLEDACLDAEKFAANYLKNIMLDKLSEETPWTVFASYQWDIYSREFQYLLSNKKSFEDKLGERVVNAKLYDTYLAQYQEVFESEELHSFGMKALLYSLENVSFTGSDTLKLMMNLHQAEYSEDWEEYADFAVELVGMSQVDDPEQLNELAWKFYLFVENRRHLEIASTWAQQAVNSQPAPTMIDTYASLQYKLGNRKQAVELEKKALELARELYDDTSHYEYQLKKFEGN